VKRPQISIHRFATDMVSRGDAFDAFRSRINTMFEMETFQREDRDDFRGAIDSINLGSIIVSSMRTDSFRFERPRARLVRDFLDHIMLRIDLDRALHEGGRPVALTIIDLGLVSPIGVTPPHNVSAVLSRASLGEAAHGISQMHGQALAYPQALFLAEHVLSLFRLGMSSNGAPAPEAMLSLTPALVAACLQPSDASLRQARRDLDTMLVLRAKSHIQAHLKDPALSPDSVARAIGVSRSVLYRLFDAAGGVARAIREARLREAARSLSRMGPAVRIGDISHGYCFASDAHFSRAFKAQYGCTPSEFRTAVIDTRSGSASPDQTDTVRLVFPVWLTTL
jgi:AraC-like DNA-binding protein